MTTELLERAASRSDRKAPQRHRDLVEMLPYAMVGVAVLFGLWTLRAERLPVAYPNDSAVHSLSVRFALAQWSAGHFPLDSWFPYLSLGSPFFMHYQATPATLIGLVSFLVNPAQAFSWSLYLLLASWPVSVYFSARLFGLNRWQAGTCAAIAPLVMSITGYGYEQQSYDWLGNGLWSQLFGMWMLPLSWGFTWQAIGRGRHRFAAVLTLSATIAFHYLTGFLAGASLFVWIVLSPTELLLRLRRAALVALGALGATLYITVPVVLYQKWGAVNQFQIGTFWNNSYGARRILSWLVEGQLFDSGRVPVITVLFGAGVAVCVFRFIRDERARALLGILVLSLLLYFGRTTFGSLVNLLPGSQSLLFQRYNSGVDLAAILLAGVGACALGNVVVVLGPRLFRSLARSRGSRAARFYVGLLGAAAIVAALYPGWSQILTRGNEDSVAINYQRYEDATEGQDVQSLLAVVRAEGRGRVYAGMPSNWGASFKVGEVPVYIYLADSGIDAVGFTLRTSSLMTDPEAYFDQYNAGDYKIFGIHYLLLPSSMSPPVPAHLLRTAGLYALWGIGSGGYFELVDTIGTIPANNVDLGSQTASLLRSSGPEKGRLPVIAYEGATPSGDSARAASELQGAPGTVLSEHVDLAEGRASALVSAARRSVVLLDASYDPGWKVSVDGRTEPTVMVAPALVGVEIGTGVHTVSFHYAAFSYYPELLAFDAGVLIAFALVPRLRRRRAERRSATLAERAS